MLFMKVQTELNVLSLKIYDMSLCFILIWFCLCWDKLNYHKFVCKLWSSLDSLGKLFVQNDVGRDKGESSFLPCSLSYLCSLSALENRHSTHQNDYRSSVWWTGVRSSTLTMHSHTSYSNSKNKPLISSLSRSGKAISNEALNF